MDTMARYFTRVGHRVTTISSRPGGRTIERGETGTRILVEPLTFPGMGRLRVTTLHTFYLRALAELRNVTADVVHSLYFTDALAAISAARRRSFATVFQMNGVAIPGISCRRFPPEAPMYRRAIAAVDARISCSEFVRDVVREHFGVDSEVIVPMVDLDLFYAGPKRSGLPPRILAAGDFTVPRKGIRVLLEAFPLVKCEVPEAELVLSGHMPDPIVDELVAAMPARIRGDVHRMGLGTPEDLPAQFRDASVLAMPSMGEPSGGVVLEALAAGTPVVATDHGGLPEFITPSVGVLFEPRTDGEESRNFEGLADALVRGIALSRQPVNAEACRAQAARFSSHVQGAKLERLYRSLRR